MESGRGWENVGTCGAAVATTSGVCHGPAAAEDVACCNTTDASASPPEPYMASERNGTSVGMLGFATATTSGVSCGQVDACTFPGVRKTDSDRVTTCASADWATPALGACFDPAEASPFSALRYTESERDNDRGATRGDIKAATGCTNCGSTFPADARIMESERGKAADRVSTRGDIKAGSGAADCGSIFPADVRIMESERGKPTGTRADPPRWGIVAQSGFRIRHKESERTAAGVLADPKAGRGDDKASALAPERYMGAEGGNATHEPPRPSGSGWLGKP